MSTVLAVSAGTHQRFLNENTCTYIMLWSSGMKLVAFPDARPDAVLLLLAAIGLAVLLLICNTHNTHKAWAIRKPLHTQNASWCVQRQDGKHATCLDPDTFNRDQWQTLLRERERESGGGGGRERERVGGGGGGGGEGERESGGGRERERERVGGGGRERERGGERARERERFGLF